MLKERKVELKLTVRVYYDGEFDQEELKQELLKTLNDNWDCSLEISNIESEQNYNG